MHKQASGRKCLGWLQTYGKSWTDYCKAHIVLGVLRASRSAFLFRHCCIACFLAFPCTQGPSTVPSLWSIRTHSLLNVIIIDSNELLINFLSWIRLMRQKNKFLRFSNIISRCNQVIIFAIPLRLCDCLFKKMLENVVIIFLMYLILFDYIPFLFIFHFV